MRFADLSLTFGMREEPSFPNCEKIEGSFPSEVGLEDIVFHTPSSAIFLSKMRVRSVLKACDKRTRAALLRLLPKEAKIPPTLETARYPSGLLTALPKPNQYAYLGLIAEHLLRLPVAELSDLLRLCESYMPAAGVEKVRKSKTTAPFGAHSGHARKVGAYSGRRHSGL